MSKRIRNIATVLLAAMLIAQCSKKDDGPVDWQTALSSTAWAGEYQSNGLYVGRLPFSLKFTATTFDWYFVDGSYVGSWQVTDNNKLTLTINGGTVITADITKDSLVHFNVPNTLQWRPIGAVSAAIPTASQLEGTVWKGTQNGQEMKIEFLPDKKLRTVVNTTTSPSMDYTIQGPAVAWTYSTGPNNEEKGFGALTSPKTLTGAKRTFISFFYTYTPWTVSR